MKNCVIKLQPILKKNGLLFFGVASGDLDLDTNHQSRLRAITPAFAEAARLRCNFNESRLRTGRKHSGV